MGMPKKLERLKEVCQERSFDLTFVWLRVPAEIAKKRLRKRPISRKFNPDGVENRIAGIRNSFEDFPEEKRFIIQGKSASVDLERILFQESETFQDNLRRSKMALVWKYGIMWARNAENINHVRRIEGKRVYGIYVLSDGSIPFTSGKGDCGLEYAATRIAKLGVGIGIIFRGSQSKIRKTTEKWKHCFYKYSPFTFAALTDSRPSLWKQREKPN